MVAREPWKVLNLSGPANLLKMFLASQKRMCHSINLEHSARRLGISLNRKSLKSLLLIGVVPRKLLELQETLTRKRLSIDLVM
jgi:hypothetical protein